MDRNARLNREGKIPATNIDSAAIAADVAATLDDVPVTALEDFTAAGVLGATAAGATAQLTPAQVRTVIDLATEIATAIAATALGGDLTGTPANAQIGAGAVGTTELGPSSVTSAKVGTNTLPPSRLTDFTAAGFLGSAGAAATSQKTVAQSLAILGVEAGATADMTAAEILAELLTVDGAGSGLDADTLDGISSAGFATAAQLAAVNNAAGVAYASNLIVP